MVNRVRDDVGQLFLVFLEEDVTTGSPLGNLTRRAGTYTRYSTRCLFFVRLCVLATEKGLLVDSPPTTVSTPNLDCIVSAGAGTESALPAHTDPPLAPSFLSFSLGYHLPSLFLPSRHRWCNIADSTGFRFPSSLSPLFPQLPSSTYVWHSTTVLSVLLFVAGKEMSGGRWSENNRRWRTLANFGGGRILWW
jgi:hypothetical protein